MSTIILSDLHLGPGRDPRTGLYSPQEDFFADDAFAALLDHHSSPSPFPPRIGGACPEVPPEPVEGLVEGDRGGAGEEPALSLSKGRGGGRGDTPPVERNAITAKPSPPHRDGDNAAGHVAEPRHHDGDTETPGLAPGDDHPVTTLVLAGDTFNLWEMDPRDELHQCAIGHPTFFTALRNWLSAGNQVFFIPGNHDFQLAFPPVQDTLRRILRSDNPANPLFSHFYHDPPRRLYVEHGDRYTEPRKPGQPPNSYRRDYYFTSVLKSRLPVASVYRSHYISQVLATDPLAMLPAWRNLPGYLFDPPFKLPPRAGGENVTLHTINVNIITANWKRAEKQARTMHALVTTSILLKLAASALPGAALAAFLLTGNVPGALALLAAAAIARTLGAAAAHTGQDLAQLDLPRAAASDIAPAVERAGVKTLIFGHSHIPDRAKFGRLTYINTGAWVNVIAPLSAVAPPTRTYAHVDDDGTARLLQWGEHGPVEPILIRRG